MTDGAPVGPPLAALVVGPTAACVVLPSGSAVAPETRHWPLTELVGRIGELESRLAPRWVVWSAAAALREVVAARERAIRETLLPIIAEQLAHFGRRVEEPEMLGRALVAMHDGTTVQSLMEPDQNTYRTELFVRLIHSYSTPDSISPEAKE